MTERLARRTILIVYALGIVAVLPTRLQVVVAGGFTLATWAYLAASRGEQQPPPALDETEQDTEDAEE